MNRPLALMLISVVFVAAVLVTSGCEDIFKTDIDRWMAADELVRHPDGSHMSIIHHYIGPADTREDQVPNATPPTEEDATYREEDYVIGPTDILDITIMDLFNVGQEAPLRREVSDAGYIDLPFLTERIKANGLTQEQLKAVIKESYAAGILKDAVVSITVVQRKQNTFSILGSMNRTGTYNLLRKDMRLLEALAVGGDVTSYTVKYVYVIRPSRAVAVGESNQAATVPGRSEELGPLPPPIAPGEIRVPPTGPSTQGELEDIQKVVPLQPKTSQPAGTLPAPSVIMALADTSTSASAPVEGGPAPAGKGPPFVYINGKWVPVNQGPGAGAAAAAPSRAAGGQPASAASTRRSPLSLPAEGDANATNPFDQWRRRALNEETRIIAINFDSLMKGDHRQNVVIRDNDVVFVPRDMVGEFYVGGEVIRPGVYSLTARLITVKMAIVAAGNVSATSWPKNSILIRRIGENQEQVIPLDVEAIFHGDAADLFLKPDDVVVVGSSIMQPFLAVMRNAFRFSYGFGFVYDRNFNDVSPGQVFQNSHRFTRW